MRLLTGNISWCCRLSFLVFVSAVAGCAQVGETVDALKEKAFGSSDVESIELQPTDRRESILTARAVGRTTSLRPDQLCAVPQDEFEYGEVLKKRFGTEAVLRLQTLMTSDFTRADLSREQKQMLKVLAQDTLWIPAPLESLMGNLLFRHEKEHLKTVSREGAGEKYWDVSKDLFTQLLNVAPRTPFDIELVILRRGRPNALAGGTIFVDRETVSTAISPENSAQRAKLAFVYAHELAHVFKRHKAKQIQNMLIETDDGLAVLRSLVTGMDPSGELDPMAWISSVFDKMATAKRIVELLQTRQAEFTRTQEHEADSCAAYLMVAAGLGDPAAAFRTYARTPEDSSDAESPLTTYDMHPPHRARQRVVEKASKNAKRAMMEWKRMGKP